MCLDPRYISVDHKDAAYVVLGWDDFLMDIRASQPCISLVIKYNPHFYFTVTRFDMHGVAIRDAPVEVVSEPMLDLVGGKVTPTELCGCEIMNHGYVPVTVDQVQFLPSCWCTMHTYVGLSTHCTSLISFYHHSIYTAYCIVLV